jgi:hypothetical protein
LATLFGANPRLGLLHLRQWDFTPELQALVPTTVRFLRISVGAAHGIRQHSSIQQPHHPPPACFQSVRALSVDCFAEECDTLIPSFARYVPGHDRSGQVRKTQTSNHQRACWRIYLTNIRIRLYFFEPKSVSANIQIRHHFSSHIRSISDIRLIRMRLTWLLLKIVAFF